MNPDNQSPQVIQPQPKDPVLEAIEGLRKEVTDKFSAYDERLASLPEELTQVVQPVPPVEETPQSQWQPKSWDDFVALAEQKGEQKAREILEARDAQITKQQEDQLKTQAKTGELIDKQLEDLTKEGYLPQVGDRNNTQDAGISARRELLAYGVHLGVQDVSKLPQVAASLKAHHESGLTFDAQTNSFVRSNPSLAGKYAPVGSSSSRSSATTTNGLNYDTIHKARNLDDIVAYAQQNNLS